MSSRPFLIRLMLPFLLLISLIAVVCGGVIYAAGKGTVHWEQVRGLDRVSSLVRGWSLTERTILTTEQSTQLKDIGNVLGARVTLIAGDGKVFFDTHANPATMVNHNDRPEVQQARTEHVGSSARDSTTLGDSAIYLAELLDENQSNGVVVRLSYPKRTWASLETPVWAVLVGSVASAVVMVVGLAVILQTRWIGPTRELAAAAEKMSTGEWYRRVTPRGAEDVRFFSNKLNLLAGHAERQLAELSDQRQNLRALVDTLPDPILVTDAEQKVQILNAPAAELLDLQPAQVIGRKTASVVSDEALLQLLELEGQSEPVQRVVRLNRSGQRLTYQAVATPTAGGGVLLLLRDVTAMATLVQMKTDFVANASHELRTPIAAIKIALETLREVYGDDPEQAEKCVSIIDGHVRRLEEMLRDLLDLSRVENPDVQPKLAEIQPSELFAAIRAALGVTARQKLVELKCEDERSPENRLMSDERLLNLIVKNLVENSIKFTPPGGSVTIRFADNPAEAGGINLSVTDTGIGIPQEHIDRVFERFYQVDPARSGTAGRGTGLGLAIVKHAVAGLGGSVKIESEVGVGTTVTCLLPRSELTTS